MQTEWHTMSTSALRVTASAVHEELSTRHIADRADLEPYLAPLRRRRTECVLVILLDTGHTIVGSRTISKGSISASLLDARMIFRPAIVARASAVILAHNHPSGTVTPSAEDLAITTKIKAAGKILDIPLLDHLIVTRTETIPISV